MPMFDDKPKHSDRTMTQTMVFVVGILFLAFLLATFESEDDSLKFTELLIFLGCFITWLVTLIWIGHAKK